MNYSRPGFPVHPELAQTHVHRVGNAIQPSHSLSSPSPPALCLLKGMLSHQDPGIAGQTLTRRRGHGQGSAPTLSEQELD